MNSVYKIKKGLKTPMIIAALLSMPVFADLMINRSLQLSMMVLALLLMMLFYLLTINNLLRKVSITDHEIAIRGIGGKKHIPAQDITFIDGVTMGSKQFVTITSNKRHYFIPNSFENFPEMLSTLEKVAKEETIGEGFKALKDNIVPRKSDIAGAWITVIVLVIVLFVILYQR
jgi:hypothetical protein